MKTIKILLYALLALIVAGLFSLNTSAVRTWTMGYLERSLSEALQQVVSIGDVSFHLPFNVRLHNLKGDVPKRIEIESLDIQASPLQFLHTHFNFCFHSQGLIYESFTFADFTIRGQGSIADKKNLNAHFTASAIYQGTPISLMGDMNASREKMGFSNVSLTDSDDDLKVTGHGEFSDSTFKGEFSGTLQNCPRINSWLPFAASGNADFKAKINWSPSGLSAEFETFLKEVSNRDMHFKDVVISAALSDCLQSPKGRLKATANEASGQGLTVGRFSFEALRQNDEQPWHFKVACTDPAEVYLTGQWRHHAHGNTLSFASGKIKVQEHQLDLQKPIEITVLPEKLILPECLFNAGQGILSISARVENHCLEGEASCENIALRPYGLLLNLPGIFGRLSGTLKFKISEDDLDGSFAIQGSSLGIDSDCLKNPPCLDAFLKGSLSREEISLHGVLYGKECRVATVDANIPVDPLNKWFSPSKPIFGLIKSSGDITPIVHQFISPQTHAAGNYDLTINLSGTLQNPEWRGSGSLSEGTFESLDSGASLKDITAEFELDDQKFTLASLSGKDPQGGHFSGTGILELKHTLHFPFHIDFEFTQCHLLNLDNATGIATGSLKCAGNFKEGSLSGTLNVDKLHINLPDQSTKEFAPLDITYINIEPGETPPTRHQPHTRWPITLDIRLSSPNHIFIKGKNLSSEWKGDISLKGTTQNPLAYGDLSGLRGQYHFNGKPFNLSRGTINFAGEPDRKNSLFIIASMDIDQVIAEVILKGSIKSPVLTFRSNPPLSQREILSLILFGKGSSEINPFQGNELAKSITKLKAGNDKPDIFDRLKKNLGIDRVQVNQNPNGDPNDISLQIGKYFSKGIFVGITRNILSESHRVGLEANLLKNVKVQAELGDDTEGQLHLKWKHDY